MKGRGRPKLALVITSIGHHLHIETEDIEGYNSLVKGHARQAPSIGADLLNARINLKADCGHIVRNSQSHQKSASVREALKLGEAPRTSKWLQLGARRA